MRADDGSTPARDRPVPPADRAKPAPTLSGRLLAWVVAALAAVWFAFVVVGFRTGAEEARELADSHLASVAELMLGDHGRAGRYVEEFAQVLSVAVWDADGHLVEHRGPAPAPAFDRDEGFGTWVTGSPPTTWRTFARWTAGEPRQRVMVMLDAGVRDELAWDIAGDMAEPGLWLLPAAVLLIGLVVRRGLLPLRELSDEVHTLDVRHPAPLKAQPRHDELRAMVDAIDALTARANEAIGRERDLAGELAHELRTPLTSIALQARALQGPQAPDERDATLQRLEADALRAGDVITELLALARASRTELSEAAAPVDLGALARGLVADLGPRAVADGRDLAVEGADFSVRGHAVLLQLALRNLVDNALGHTPAGTQVVVRLDPRAHALWVIDDGARAAGPKPGTTGLKLGHRVVEKIAAIHGARFEAADPPAGHTTAYRISFPAPA